MTSLPGDLLVYGMGELGSMYALSALRLGVRVTPVVRTTPRPLQLGTLPAHTPLLVAVGEDALDAALKDIPAPRRDDVALLQNGLFPQRWQAAGVTSPTVLIPWLSRKKGRPTEVARPTLIHGPHAAFFAELHRTLELPAGVATTSTELENGLASKYAFIITINALGLKEDLTLGQWLHKDPGYIRALIVEGHLLAELQLGRAVPRDDVERQVLEAIAALPAYPARGRTAKTRIQQALALARQDHVAVPLLELLITD